MGLRHMLNLNFSPAFGFCDSYESLWKWNFHWESWPWYMQKLMRKESLIIWMTVDFLKTSKYDFTLAKVNIVQVFNRVRTDSSIQWNFIPVTRNGWKYKSSDFSGSDSDFSTAEQFTCAVTYSYPNASWKSYDGEASRYYIYGICGLKTSQTINGSVLQQSCDNAARMCGNDVECIRNKIVQDQQSGRYSFCPWGGFNLLVNPNPGQSAYKGYNGAKTWNNSVQCIGFCTA